ncbi:MAG: lamin tail domain-containing protein [Ignavibacteria bacterium]|jgi:hypothetical protein
MIFRNLFKVLFLFPIITYSQTHTELTLTEVMFRPDSSNTEFIEVYNTSTTKSLDLNGLKIKYHSKNSEIIIPHTQGTILGPGEFAVIFENDYDFTNGIYNTIIPADALILKITDKTFGGGMSNSSDREIKLLDASDAEIESYTYSADNAAGISDEKINLTKDSSSANWGNSTNPNGTPGSINSITPVQFDVGINSISLGNNPAIEKENFELNTLIENRGTGQAENFTVNIYGDDNKNSIGEMSEKISTHNITTLASDSTELLTDDISNLEEGTYQFLAEIDYSSDQNASNNKAVITIEVLPAQREFNDIVINEIMYKPQSGEPEWIEIFNRSNEEINLRGWKVLDASSSFSFPKENLILTPGEFLVISDDEAINDFYEISSKVIVGNLPSLNNSGDFLAVKDSLDRFIDSLTYQSSWGGDSGTSLERVDADSPSYDINNWMSSTSTNDATPGNVNSVIPLNYDLALISFSAVKNEIIDNESNSFTGTIQNIGMLDVGEFTLKIYFDEDLDSLIQQDELIGTRIFNELLAGSSINFEIENIPSQTGLNNFIAEIDFDEDENLENNFAQAGFYKIVFNENRNDLIINEIMYAPLPPEPEWIELFNRCSESININGYSLADSKDTSKITGDDFVILPNRYLIIAKEESFFEKYDLDSNIIIKSFPSLNNSGDRILLLDPFYRIIDSLVYTSKWGGSNGKSLERINTELPSADSSNWVTSQSSDGSSPGTKNAVVLKSKNISINSITSLPGKPLKGDDVNIIVELENKGDTNSIFVLNLFEDINHDSIEDNLIATSATLELIPGEIASHTFENQIQNIDENKSFVVTADLEDDIDLEDNKISITLLIGYPEHSLIINEIMYKPQNGEPEWVELYNNSVGQIDIKDWSIADLLTNPVTRKITADFIFVEPQSYLVIAKDSSILSYHDQVPSTIIISSFANLNNSDDGVVIKDAHGNTIDSVFYKSTWESESGFSIERIDFNYSSVDSVNWQVSNDIEQSTPGRNNSEGTTAIEEKTHDLAVNTISFYPSSPLKGDEIFVSSVIENIGDTTAENFLVNFYYQIDESFVLFSEENNLQLNIGDTLSITSSNSFEIQNPTVVKTEVIYDKDENENNNFLETEIEIGFEPASMLITEIMYAPTGGEPEWIELYNNSNEQIDITNWGINDASSSIKKIATENITVSPKAFFIVTTDSTSFKNTYSIDTKVFETNFGSLGNSGDAVFIYDPLNNIIDSIRYSSDWGGNNGFSLERVNFENHSQDSTNWSTSLSYDRATPGIANTVSNITAYSRDQIIINEIMFEPGEDNTEFIEIYNNSDDYIELGGFNLIDDKNEATQLSPFLYSLPPKGFFILSCDSCLFNNYPDVNENEINITNTSSLGLSNDEDVILIKDFFGNTIDSLKYNTGWHNRNILNTKNRSLERLNPNLSANDASNWSTSVASAGATPCEKNSIFIEQEISESKISISPNPFSPDNDGFEDFTSINYSLSKPIAQVRIKIFDSKGRLVRTLSNNQPVGSTGSIIFDGLNDDGNPLKLGIYILYMEVVDAQNGSTEAFKKAIVVARKL